MRILGLDASSSTIGVAIIDVNNKKIKLYHHEYYKPPKKGHLIERLYTTKQYIIQLLNNYKPDEVAIEEFIPFMKAKSQAATTITLGIFNRTIGLTIYEETKKMPHMLNVNSVRHTLKFGKKAPKKEEIPEVVSKHLGIEFPYYKKINRRTKKEQIMVESYDVADSIAIGLAYIKKFHNDKK